LTRTTPHDLIDGIRAGDRRALARAITLAESTRRDHRSQATEVLDGVLDRTGGATRVGISGAPGVGKSTFIEAFGTHLTATDHKVAVLAVDPSSTRSGGSILGDKTRMSELVNDPDAFVRPSPSGGELGGVARRTREAILLCEAAGFDVVLVETVGVGQSETAVDDMVDLFLLLAAPAGGDELQGIKRGIMELADLIVVNKADGDLAPAAKRAQADLKGALQLLRPKRKAWKPRVLLASALQQEGVDAVWDTLVEAKDALAASGELDRRRAQQARAWMWTEVQVHLLEELRHSPAVKELLTELEGAVAQGDVSPLAAADRLLVAFLDAER
jgi:LAO/AO transport system kinase